MDNYKAKVAEWKKQEIQIIKELASKYKLIGIVNMSGLPAFQLLKIKGGLRDIAELKMARKNLIKRALAESGKTGIDQMINKIEGKAALLFTNEDAFKIFKILKKNIAYTKAKAGQIAPKDIIIPAGPTNFLAGPMIGELGRIGFKTGVEGGKIAIKEDKILAKTGEVINAEKADLMSKFGIEPMEVGLRLTLTYSNGEILSRDVLDIDEEAIMNSIVNLAREAILFGVEIGYATEETVEIMISKGYREAEALKKELKIEENFNINDSKQSIGDLEIKEVKPEVKIEPVEIKEEPVQEAEIERPVIEIEEEVKVKEVKPEVKIEPKIGLYQKPVKEIRKEAIVGSEIIEDVEKVIEEQAKKASKPSANMDLVNQTVSSIIGGKTLNTNPKVQNEGKPSDLRKVQNQATINFERDSQVAADFLRKATDLKIKNQSRGKKL